MVIAVGQTPWIVVGSRESGESIVPVVMRALGIMTHMLKDWLQQIAGIKIIDPSL